MNDKQYVDKRFCRTSFGLLFIAFFVMSFNLIFAQDFRNDSVILQQKTITKNDSLGIVVLQRVIATTKYLSNAQPKTPIAGYVVISEYWLFWNNKSDSIRMRVEFGHKIIENNFIISFRKLQNETNAVILEYSQTKDPTPFWSDTERIFQIINLDSKKIIFDIRHPEITVKHHSVKISETEFIDEFDTYRQKYQLTFDDNNNITLTQTESWIQKGKGGQFGKSKAMIPVQFYEFTHHEDGTIWFKKYKN